MSTNSSPPGIWVFLRRLRRHALRLWGANSAQSGTTLVEVIVAAGIIGAVVVGMMQYSGFASRNQKKVRAKAVMQSIAKDIEYKLKNPLSIYESILQGDNVDLIQCMVPDIPPGCEDKLRKRDVPVGFKLATQSDTPGRPDIIAGTAAAPVFYDITGRQCTFDQVKDPNCVFKAESFFYVTCPIDRPGCAQQDGTQKIYSPPDVVHVGYQVTQMPGTLKKLGTFDPIPKYKYFYSLRTLDIYGPYQNSKCNLGAILKGYRADGAAICECTQPNITKTTPPVKNRRGVLCEATKNELLTCGPNQVWRGYRSDGTALCLDFDDAYDCRHLQFEPGDEGYLRGDCSTLAGNGYWVSSDARVNCSFYCAVQKDGENSDGFGYCKSDDTNDDRTEGPWPKLGPGVPTGKAKGRYMSGGAFGKYGYLDGAATEKNFLPEGLNCLSRNLTCCRAKVLTPDNAKPKTSP